MVSRDVLLDVLRGYVDGSLREHLDFDGIIDSMRVEDGCFVFRFPSFVLFLRCDSLEFVDVWVE